MAELPLDDDLGYDELFAACDLAAEARGMGKPVEPVIQTFLSPSEPLLLTNFAENPHVAYDYPDANPKPLVTLPPSPQTEQPPGSSEGRRRHENHNPKPLVALPPSAQLPFYSEQQMGSSKGQWRPTNHQRITTGHYGGPPAQPDYTHGLNSGKKQLRGDDRQSENFEHQSNKRQQLNNNGNHCGGRWQASHSRAPLQELSVQNTRIQDSHELAERPNIEKSWPEAREYISPPMGGNTTDAAWMSKIPSANVFKHFQEAAMQESITGYTSLLGTQRDHMDLFHQFLSFNWPLWILVLVQGDYMMMQGKPFIKKSGWRKIAFFFNISFEIKDRDIKRDPNSNVTRAEFVVRASMESGRFADGWGSCDRGEKRFSKPNHDIPSTAETRAKNRACQDLLGIGEYKVGE